MRLTLAWKAFWKAWKNPQKARDFLLDHQEKPLKENSNDYSHLHLLAILQQSGRLIDFFKEDISSYTDSQVGSAVRKIHSDCGKSLEDIVTIRPIFEQPEGSPISVPSGYDPRMIKLVGKVKDDSNFSGTLVHKGWKAHKLSLPKKFGGHSSEIICPAEVEVR